MLKPRLIPCLLLRQGGLYKTVQFGSPKYVGDPLNTVRIFNEKLVDELVVLDIDASRNGSPPNETLLAQLASECRMPLCYGGGVKSVEHFERLISLGIEKVAVGSAALDDLSLVTRAADRVGSQSVVVVIDVKRQHGGAPRVVSLNATRSSDWTPWEFAAAAQQAGAGEIVLNSVDNDGLMQGYDLDLVEDVRRAVSVPLTVLGGAGCLDDVRTLVRRYPIIGAAAGSLFVFKGRFRAVLVNYPTGADRARWTGAADGASTGPT